MVFDSLTFVLFFALCLALYFARGLEWRARKAILLVASYAFYMAWNPLFAGLLVFSTVVDWYVAAAMHRASDPGKKKALLWISLTSNLGLLGFFKYSMFFAEAGTAIARAIGFKAADPSFSILLPVGISFYTFQTLSYTIDIYRGTLKPARSVLDFALFVSFFPQLVAGPIVRAADFIPQLDEPKPVSGAALGWGLSLLVLGLFEKIVLADALMAPVANLVYDNPGTQTAIDAWTGTLAFTGQIFFDFAGYSTCAIGVALCLGFKLPDNFKFPYAARGFSDFWRRWHISLSTWLRDYLYISLGGNRKGSLRTYFNLAMTMLLGGLWHGSSWAFVVWGALHGLYLVIERLLGPYIEEVPGSSSFVGKFIGWALTFLAVVYAWVFFRARTFESAWQITLGMIGQGGGGEQLVSSGQITTVLVYLGALVLISQFMRGRTLRDVAARTPEWLLTLALAVMLLAIMTAGGKPSAFLYFQF